MFGEEILRCRCGSNIFIEVKIGVKIKKGRAYGGQKQLRCHICGNVVL